MELYPGRALERAMKVQEVILRAIGGHRARQAAAPDPTSEVPLQPGPLPRAHLPPSGRDSQCLLRSPPAGPVRRLRRLAGRSYPTSEKKLR